MDDGEKKIEDAQAVAQLRRQSWTILWQATIWAFVFTAIFFFP